MAEAKHWGLGTEDKNLGDVESQEPRVLARFDLKDSWLVKTRQLEGLRKIAPVIDGITSLIDGTPGEVIVNDVVATLYGNRPPLRMLEELRASLQIPITFIGGVNSLSTAEQLVHSGADRIGVNSALVGKKELLSELLSAFGAQSVVVQVDTRKVSGNYRVFTQGGRVMSETPLEEWLCELDELTTGELMLTSISTQGTGKGFPLELVEIAMRHFRGPLLLNGGLRHFHHIKAIWQVHPNVSFSASPTGGH